MYKIIILRALCIQTIIFFQTRCVKHLSSRDLLIIYARAWASWSICMSVILIGRIPPVLVLSKCRKHLYQEVKGITWLKALRIGTSGLNSYPHHCTLESGSKGKMCWGNNMGSAHPLVEVNVSFKFEGNPSISKGVIERTPHNV